MKRCHRVSLFSCLIIVMLGLAAAAGMPVLAVQSVQPNMADSEVKASLASLQIPFVQNEGQVGDEQVKYYAKTFAGTVYVTDDGIVYNLPKGEEGGWVLQEEFAGSNALAPATVGAPGAPVNYYIGNVEKHVSSYQEITLGEVYDKIKVNLKAYGDNVEKIFTVAPGGDPAKIALKVAGADSLSVNEQGELELATGLGTVKMTCPVAYQIIDGQRVDVDVSYVINGGSYGFKIGEYDRACPLVIDPLLASTYLGGTLNEGLSSNTIKLDAAGNVYIAGNTKSSYFFLDSQGQPITGGYNQTLNGTAATDAFVVKLDGDLSQYLAATYFGGGSTESASGITLDGSGNVYVTGYTKSLDFPLALVPCLDSSKGDIYVAKLGGDNLNLSTTTCFGGTLMDNPVAVALDSDGHVFVTGTTQSGSFHDAAGQTIAVNGLHTSLTGTVGGLVVKFSADLSQVLASTYLGGSSGGDGLYTIAIDNSGNVYVGGILCSSYPHADTALRKDYKVTSGNDGIVLELNNDLNSLVASTFVGGTGGNTKVKSIAFDSAGNIIVTGDTTDTSFPTTTTGTVLAGPQNTYDTFVFKIKSDLTGDLVDGVVKPLASTLFGGTSNDFPKDLALDTNDNVYMAGYSNSTSLPGNTGDSYQQGLSGGSDAYVTKFESNLSNPATTYIGGAGSDIAYGLALNPAGNVYITGTTSSSNFPTAVAPGQSRVAQGTSGGGTDIFIAKLTGDLAATAAADSTAPIWTSGSMDSSSVTETSLTLTWEGAMDDTGIVSYNIYQGNSIMDTVSGQTTCDITGLTAATSYTFKVEAVDTTGNISADGPSKTVTTAGAADDLTAPTWPAGSALTATDIAETSLTLTWTPPATDNVGVTDYKVFQNTVEMASVSSSIYSSESGSVFYNYSVTNLAPGNPYTFKVEAVDAAGNISSDGPGVDVTTTNPDTSPPYWSGGEDPNKITFNALSPTTGYFEWPAASDNVGVTGYNIYLMNPPGNGDYSVITTVYGTNNCIITLPDTPGISYPISMKAFDAAGNLSNYYSYAYPMQVVPGESYGVYLVGAYLTAISSDSPPASSTGASIEDSTSVPLQPMIKLAFKNNVVSDGVWDNTSYSNKNCITMQITSGANTGTKVQINVIRFIDDSDGFNERNNIFITPVDTLTPGTQYKIIIDPDLMPKNQKRSMTYERVVNFTTEATASGSPAWPSGGTLTASNPTASGMTLSWTPADSGAGVTSYVVIKNNSDIIQAVDGTTASCDVTGLTSGTDYTFQVQSFDSATSWSSPGPSLTTETAAADPETVSAPVATPDSGALTLGTTVALATATDEATIYYTVDGSTPTTSSLEYSTPITINEPLTIKAIAVKTGMTDSSVMEAVYTIQGSAGSSESGVYTLVLAADPAYTIGRTAAGIDAFTVESGITGNHTFTVTISPVAAHEGSEKAVFVQLRSGIPLKIKAVEEDFDTVNTAETSFNVEPGDVVKVLIVDDLYAAFDRIATVLAQ